MNFDQSVMGRIEQPPRNRGTGAAFGTFGELLQGRFVEQHRSLDFLVTFPMEIYSHAAFIPDDSINTVVVLPAWKQKSQLLANRILEHYEMPPGGRLILDSDLPAGKGLASSSADLVATARALSSSFGLPISNELLQSFMREIEPSDGVMYPGVVSFYHRQVQLREFLGPLPPIAIVGLDEGGMLDTCQFNQYPKNFTRSEEQEYLYLLNTISTAIKKEDICTIGKVSTRSALLNQRINKKQTLYEIIAICEEVQGLGIAVAHSGTCIGILLSPQNELYPYQLQTASNHLARFGMETGIYYSLGFDERRQSCMSTSPAMKKGEPGADVLTQNSFFLSAARSSKGD